MRKPSTNATSASTVRCSHVYGCFAGVSGSSSWSRSSWSRDAPRTGSGPGVTPGGGPAVSELQRGTGISSSRSSAPTAGAGTEVRSFGRARPDGAGVNGPAGAGAGWAAAAPDVCWPAVGSADDRDGAPDGGAPCGVHTAPPPAAGTGGGTGDDDTGDDSGPVGSGRGAGLVGRAGAVAQA